MSFIIGLSSKFDFISLFVFLIPLLLFCDCKSKSFSAACTVPRVVVLVEVWVFTCNSVVLWLFILCFKLFPCLPTVHIFALLLVVLASSTLVVSFEFDVFLIAVFSLSRLKAFTGGVVDFEIYFCITVNNFDFDFVAPLNDEGGISVTIISALVAICCATFGFCGVIEVIALAASIIVLVLNLEETLPDLVEVSILKDSFVMFCFGILGKLMFGIEMICRGMFGIFILGSDISGRVGTGFV